MRIDEILKQYDREWLLIKVNECDEDFQPIDGEVIFHSSSGDAVSREMLKLKGDDLHIAMLYAGDEFADDVAFLL